MTHSTGLFLILLTAVSACNREQTAGDRHQGQPVSAPNAEHQPQDQLMYLPEQKMDSIQIEGSSQPLTLKVVQPPASLPFVTYVPSDMLFEHVAADEGEGFTFYTNFGGRKNENAYLLMFIYPEGTKQVDAVRLVKAWVASRADVAASQIEQFRYEKDGTRFVAGIDLRMHGNRYYYIAKQYPEEYSEGFNPRAQRILDEWKWLR